MIISHQHEWPIARDAEGGGLGGGGGTDENGAGSDGAAGGFADAGNATASLDGSISANAGDSNGSAPGASSGTNTSSGFGDSSGGFGSPGGATVDLSQSGSVSSNAMQFTAGDAAVLGGTALAVATGVVAAVTGSTAMAVLGTTNTLALAGDPIATAVSHAAHDLGVLGAEPSVNSTAPTGISVFESSSEQGVIDAMNADGGFASLFAIPGGQVLDLSGNGDLLATDHVAGHSLYWDNYYQQNPYAVLLPKGGVG